MSQIPPRPVLHIGLPRTGTTTLQAHLFAGHSQIDYLGHFKARIATSETVQLQGCRDPSVHALMNELAFENFRSPDLDLARASWQEIREGAGNRVPLWSHESLSTDALQVLRVRATNLKMVLGDARVFMTLRHPISLMESCYFQILRRENRQGRGGIRSWYEPIDDWFQRSVTSEMAPLLAYEQTLDLYCDVFGQDAVEVLIYEDLKADQGSHARRICVLLGIDPEEGERLVAGKIENATNARLVRRFRRLSAFPGGALLAGFLARWNSVTSSSPNRAEETRLSGVQREHIESLTRPGNRRIAERFGIDLRKYGYPV